MPKTRPSIRADGRAQSAILKVLQTRGFDPNSGARELLRMSLESYQLLLEGLMRQSGNAL